MCANNFASAKRLRSTRRAVKPVDALLRDCTVRRSQNDVIWVNVTAPVLFVSISENTCERRDLMSAREDTLGCRRRPSRPISWAQTCKRVEGGRQTRASLVVSSTNYIGTSLRSTESQRVPYLRNLWCTLPAFLETCNRKIYLRRMQDRFSLRHRSSFPHCPHATAEDHRKHSTTRGVLYLPSMSRTLS